MMKLIGVEPRARDARQALNRLRWEIDYAIEQGRPADAAPDDVAELVGIMTNILKTLDAALPDRPRDEVEALFGASRAKFVNLVNFYTTYHEVGR